MNTDGKTCTSAICPRSPVCIRFGNIAYSSPGCTGVEGEPVSLTLLGVFFIARGFATWLSRKLEVPTGSLRVSVGMDSRISGFAVRCVSL